MPCLMCTAGVAAVAAAAAEAKQTARAAAAAAAVAGGAFALRGPSRVGRPVGQQRHSLAEHFEMAVPIM